jgi:hypothetical protein
LQLRECDDPQQVFENWMMRDHLFGQEILRQAQAHHCHAIVVDGTRSIDELLGDVKAYWGLA